MLAHGMIDLVAPRAELRATLATLLRLYMARTYAPAAGEGYAALRVAATLNGSNGRHAG